MIRAALVSIVFLGITLTLILMQPASEERADAARLIAQDQSAQSQSEESRLDLSKRSYNAQATLTEVLPDYEPGISPKGSLTKQQSFGDIVALQPRPEAESPQRTPLEQMIIEAVQQGQSEAYILELVKQATAPIVQDETVSRNSVAHTNAFLSLIEGEKNPVRRELNGTQTYIVQHGDSLASIAALFYNDTRGAFEIFNANRGTMGSPDNLFVGQELVIPAL